MTFLVAITTLRRKPSRNSSPKQSYSAILNKPDAMSWAASKRPIYRQRKRLEKGRDRPGRIDSRGTYHLHRKTGTSGWKITG